MRSQKWTWALSLLMALGIAAGAADTAGASPNADSLPQTRDSSAAKFVMSGSISSGGQTVPISGSGAFSGQNALLDLTLTALMGTTSGPDKVTLSAMVVDGKLYFKTGSFGVGSDDKWYVIDPNTLTAGMPGAIMGTPGSLTDLQAMIEAAITTQQLGKETIGGAATTKYQLDVDLSKVASATGGSTAGLQFSNLTMFLWVGDADMYIHQVNTMFQTLTSTGGDLLLPLVVDLTTTFSDFDIPVAITAPANAEPLDLGASGISGLLGSMGMPVSTTDSGVGMPKTGSSSGNNVLLLALLAVGIGLVLSGVTVKRMSKVEQRT